MPVQLGLPEIDPFHGGLVEREARFSGYGRVELRRRWALHGPVAAVVGCNPSVAGSQRVDGSERDDPTSTWLINWFREHGFAEYRLVNLYPFVTSSPKECRRKADWLNNGPDWYARDALHHNLAEMLKVVKAVDQVFVCWGAIAWDDGWIDHVVEEIQSGEAPYPALWCWGSNADGSPKHPMARGRHRIRSGQKPILWRRA
jgi:hypothetical protein